MQTPDSYGSLIEMTWGGKKEVPLANGEIRKFIKVSWTQPICTAVFRIIYPFYMSQDGDEIQLAGVCEGNGFRIGFGECNGVVLPARV
jgi:fumarylacetoacetase